MPDGSKIVGNGEHRNWPVRTVDRDWKFINAMKAMKFLNQGYMGYWCYSLRKEKPRVKDS